jgi:hypothetical protein
MAGGSAEVGPIGLTAIHFSELCAYVRVVT